MTGQSLAAKAYLLACDPAARRVRDRQQTAYLIRGAALTDLVLRGRLADDDGTASLQQSGTTGDALLDELLGQVAEGKPRKWKSLVRKDSRRTLDSLERTLADEGVIELDTTPVLGILPRRRVSPRDEAGVNRLRAAVDEALRGHGEVTSVPPEDAALAALVAAVELRGVVSRSDRRKLRDRIEQLEEHGGAAIPALRKVFREVRSARIAAANSGSNGGG
ncbi:GOLPH3/VPS74 family protein [Prauserella cavernicola]|uniref:GPP34 family phosphoprotein n=1 Tax=Prauserella cavernicola TaxID=2800127 RepID=A0A934QPX1_9PSEU|nr:GPP34 family phosphoprotein [Prauserella cavernicola]MBK1783888.1 GPP34 family phosphoprotein [Prauserella cavernicola]